MRRWICGAWRGVVSLFGDYLHYIYIRAKEKGFGIRSGVGNMDGDMDLYVHQNTIGRLDDSRKDGLKGIRAEITTVLGTAFAHKHRSGA